MTGRIENYKPLSNWRDVTPEDLKREHNQKIAGVVIGVLLLFASAIGIYFILTAGHGVDNPRFLLLSYPVLGIATAGVAFLTPFLRIEACNDDFSNPVIRAERRELLKRKLHDVYKFVKSHGGIEPLVRHGIIAEDKNTAESLGTQMSEIFRAYEEPSRTLARYGNVSNKETCLEYGQAKEKVDELETRWKALQKQFTTHEPLQPVVLPLPHKQESIYGDAGLLGIESMVVDDIVSKLQGKIPEQDPQDLIRWNERELKQKLFFKN